MCERMDKMDSMSETVRVLAEKCVEASHRTCLALVNSSAKIQSAHKKEPAACQK